MQLRKLSGLSNCSFGARMLGFRLFYYFFKHFQHEIRYSGKLLNITVQNWGQFATYFDQNGILTYHKTFTVGTLAPY